MMRRQHRNTANSCHFITKLPLLSDPRPSNLI